MIIRFVRGSAWESTAIAMQEKTTMPFTPSHVEVRTLDGLSYIGAHMDGGVQARPIGYDAGKIAKQPDGSDCELLLDLCTSQDQDAMCEKFMRSHVGEPYDWQAIIGFLLPEHEHLPKHAICSALVTLMLRDCRWLQWRLAAPAHLVDPRDLLLIISTHMQIPGV